MDYLITFLEGIVTFVSPCLLPMLPLYVAYFAGDARRAAARADETRRTLFNALGFVVGFTLLFATMGALAGVAGSFFADNQRLLEIVGGIVVIVFGLNYLGALRIPLLQRTLKPQSDIVPRGFATSVAFGMVFAIGWTPCVGAFLGSALALAASSADTLHGVGLLVSYSLGLGVPFVISAVLVRQLEGAFQWVKGHYDIIDKVSGGLLVVVGVLMATGALGVWLRLLSIG